MVWIKISPVVQTYIDVNNRKGENIQPRKIRDNLYIEYTTLSNASNYEGALAD